MRRLGAGRVLVDGSIDRRAGASPRLADGVVMSTGAVLSADLDQLARRTKAAVELLTLAAVEDAALHARAAALRTSALVLDDGEAIPLDPAIVHDRVEAIVPLLRGRADVRAVVVRGALCEPLLEQHRARAPRRAADGDRRRRDESVPRPRHRARATARAASSSRCCTPIPLLAVTTNPVAPLRHRFDAEELRARIAARAAGRAGARRAGGGAVWRSALRHAGLVVRRALSGIEGEGRLLRRHRSRRLPRFRNTPDWSLRVPGICGGGVVAGRVRLPACSPAALTLRSR